MGQLERRVGDGVALQVACGDLPYRPFVLVKSGLIGMDYRFGVYYGLGWWL